MAKKSGVPTADMWGKEVLTGNGFTMLPNYLLHLNSYLPKGNKLSLKGQVVLFTLLSFSHNGKLKVYPGIDTIASCCGITRNSVTAATKELAAVGLLKISQGRISKEKGYLQNIYDLKPCVQMIRDLALKTEPRHTRKALKIKPLELQDWDF